MINISQIESKQITNDGKVILNSNVSFVKFTDVEISNWLVIDEHTEMRMDLISLAAYGTKDYVKELTKFNGLKSPLNLKKGMVLAVPDLTSLRKATKIKNIKPVPMQQQSTLGRTAKNETSINSSSASSTPSKKTNSSSNYIKKANGVIIF